MAIEVPDWYRTVALVGVDITGEPVVVLLDSTGAIMAVMKGEYAGTLKNIAVDASGRVIMIPTDPADVWGNAISMGNAELAAVLSPVKRYDRRGNVIWLESFEEGLIHVDPDGDSAPITATLTSLRARTGAFSAVIAAGPGASNWGEIFHAVPFYGTSRFGFEVSFTCDDNANYIAFRLSRNGDDEAWVAVIRFDPTQETLEYYDSAGVYQQFATGIDLSTDDRLFHTAKVVIDGTTNKYVRFMLDDDSYDLSAYDLGHLTGGAQPAILVHIKVTPNTGVSPTIYVDDFVVTQNEPPNV